MENQKARLGHPWRNYPRFLCIRETDKCPALCAECESGAATIMLVLLMVVAVAGIGAIAALGFSHFWRWLGLL